MHTRPHSPKQCQEDIAEPLLAIADCIGGDWPERSRAALLRLFRSAVAEETSDRVRLLADIKDIFDISEVDRFKSEELATKLAEIETSPWGDWENGKPMTPRELASILKALDIKPRVINFGSETKRGYLREHFEPKWERYLRQPRRSTNGSSYGS